MKKLSGFDLAMIITFAVVGVLGGGAWWYLSTKLDDAKQAVGAASQSFQQYSSKEVYLPTAANEKILKDDSALLATTIDPVIKAKLLSPDDKILTAGRQDPVAWKSDLDARVAKLNQEAKPHGVAVEPNFYYGFSRYLNANPNDEKTAVLTKQLLGIEQIATIMINAPVKGIGTVRRTYEEDESSGSPGSSSRASMDKDYLGGHSYEGDGGVYIEYPFEIEFEATTEALRKVINDLLQSPYVFVVRSLTIQNSNPLSPKISSLDQLAASPDSSVADASPGAVAASGRSNKGPQFLFGGETLKIKLRIDMIEWKGAEAAAANSGGGAGKNNRKTTPAPKANAAAAGGNNASSGASK